MATRASSARPPARGAESTAEATRTGTLVADGGGTKDEIVARAVDVERRNWQFELDFSTPDHCRDVSRILRLPGTLNRPNAEKIAKGRTIALARVVKVNWEPEKESEE